VPSGSDLGRFAAALDRQFSNLNLSPDRAARDRMLRHYDLLLRWNRRINLTRVTAPEEAAERHFGESLAFLQAGSRDWATAVDVGSGAGFPGLVLAAACPDRSITLLEPVTKKAVFLREVSRDWGNVQVRDVRVEEFEGSFEWAWMRAVNVAEVLGELGRIGKDLALWVGPDGATEARRHTEWAWEQGIPLAGGVHRQLLVGRR
jgi:16S rRNA (guanine(527)-N(7))-methyltransferase RsmG